MFAPLSPAITMAGNKASSSNQTRVPSSAYSSKYLICFLPVESLIPVSCTSRGSCSTKHDLILSSQRPVRTNQEVGGAISLLEKVGNQVTNSRQLDAKSEVTPIENEELINVMAPIAVCPFSPLNTILSLIYRYRQDREQKILAAVMCCHRSPFNFHV